MNWAFLDKYRRKDGYFWPERIGYAIILLFSLTLLITTATLFILFVLKSDFIGISIKTLRVNWGFYIVFYLFMVLAIARVLFNFKAQIQGHLSRGFLPSQMSVFLFSGIVGLAIVQLGSFILMVGELLSRF
jgi:hypothetical protein